MSSITLADLDIRYAKLKEQNPAIPTCGVKGCNNPVDITPGMGQDTSCSYHRLLFDWWMYEVMQGDLPTVQRTKRRLFQKWVAGIGQDQADAIVIDMANDELNWFC